MVSLATFFLCLAYDLTHPAVPLLNNLEYFL
ncbi:hypothetical protein GLYMA_04G156550v4 [Glycine max]|nr:hypothetical protein GLYMA_04G156550v4 [Glycine max]KAH1111529.1 hypothetical protein GYH30_010073 [Glycine max]